MLKQYFSNQTKRTKQITSVLVVLLVAGIGTYLLIGSHAATPYASTTADSGTLASGATKQTCSGSSDGSCAVFGSSSIPKHIETWAYDDGCNGGVGASSALVQQWLTYAEAHCGPNDAKIFTDCDSGGIIYCKTIQYLDTNIIYYSASGASDQWAQYSAASAGASNDDWYIHEASATSSTLNQATRITTTAFGGGWWDNITNPTVVSFYQNYTRTKYPNYDGLFMDDTGAGIDGEWYSATTPPSPKTSYEITSNAELQAGHVAMATAMTKSNGTPYLQINNGDGDNPYLTSSLPLLNNPASVVGMTSEGSPWSNNTLIPNWEYEDLLDEMGYMDHTTSDFQVLLSYDPSGSLQGRRVQAATDLLGYSPGHVVSWSDLEQNNNNLAVWPEEGIYPTGAVQSMGDPGGTGCFAGTGVECPSGGHNDIQVATGVYRREFSKCYNQGVAFGRCAAIVNDSGNAVTVPASWLTQTYTHEITFAVPNGTYGDVQSGGTVNLIGASFSPGSTSIPAADAVLLAP
jgi:hypothetical protein